MEFAEWKKFKLFLVFAIFPHLNGPTIYFHRLTDVINGVNDEFGNDVY